MRLKQSKDLFGYWNRLRGTRPAPDRAEIEPGDIRTLLGDTFILDVDTTLRAVSYRLAGTRLCAAHGRELKGWGYLGHWREGDGYDVACALRSVYEEDRPMLLSHRGMTRGHREIDWETILLPLLPTGEGSRRILGLTTPRSVPYWLGADPVEEWSLRLARPIESAPAPLVFETSMPMPPMGRKVAHLTVVEGGRQ